MSFDPNVYGYVDGQPVYSRDEFVYRSRGRGRIEDDAELVAFAKKVTHGWFEAGWERSFATYPLSDYALSEPFKSLTRSEFDRLRELQQAAREERKAAEDAREWRTVGEVHFADNSVEEIQEDKDGNRRSILKIYAHGDIC